MYKETWHGTGAGECGGGSPKFRYKAMLTQSVHGGHCAKPGVG